MPNGIFLSSGIVPKIRHDKKESEINPTSPTGSVEHFRSRLPKFDRDTNSVRFGRCRNTGVDAGSITPVGRATGDL
jgi:hypothetical protein